MFLLCWICESFESCILHWNPHHPTYCMYSCFQEYELIISLLYHIHDSHTLFTPIRTTQTSVSTSCLESFIPVCERGTTMTCHGFWRSLFKCGQGANCLHKHWLIWYEDSLKSRCIKRVMLTWHRRLRDLSSFITGARADFFSTIMEFNFFTCKTKSTAHTSLKLKRQQESQCQLRGNYISWWNV